jgi:hypothetical protein
MLPPPMSVRGLPTLPSHLRPKTLGFDVSAECLTDHLRLRVKEKFFLFEPPDNKKILLRCQCVSDAEGRDKPPTY